MHGCITANEIAAHHKATGVAYPMNGDATARAHTQFTPSAGNLWAQPGVHQPTAAMDRVRYAPFKAGLITSYEARGQFN